MSNEKAAEDIFRAGAIPQAAELSQAGATLQIRGRQYGDFGYMATAAQRIKEAMKQGPGWAALQAHQRESLEMIATKIARIVTGDPNHADSWLDIEGYARLSRERIPTYYGRPLAPGENI